MPCARPRDGRLLRLRLRRVRPTSSCCRRSTAPAWSGRRAAPRMRRARASRGTRPRARARSRSPPTRTSTRASRASPTSTRSAFESLLAVPMLDRRERLAGAHERAHGCEPREYDDDEVALLDDDRRAGRPGDRERPPLRALAAPRRRARGAGPHLARPCRSRCTRTEALADDRRHRRAAPRTPTCCALVLSPRRAAVRAPGAPPTGRPTTELLEPAAAAPLDERGPLAVPLVWKRAAHRRARLRRGRGRRSRARSARCSAPSPHQAATAVESGRGVMRELRRPGDPPPRQEQPADRGLAAAAARRRASDPQRALRDSVDRILSIAEVHDLLTASREGDVDLRRPGAPPRRACSATAWAAAPADDQLDADQVPGDDARRRRAHLLRALRQRRWSTAAATWPYACTRDGASSIAVRDRGAGPAGRLRRRARALGLKIARSLGRDDLGGTLDLGDGRPGVRAVRSRGGAR